jgi:hypothetical protein
MYRKDFQLIAEACKAAGEDDMDLQDDDYDGMEPSPGWQLFVTELIMRFRADPRFDETMFRAAAEPVCREAR